MLGRLAKYAFIFLCAPLLACAAQVSREVRAAHAPAGAEDLVSEWISIRYGEHTMLAAVARPEGRGRFPVVILLHGSHGFAREYVRLARDLSQAGVIVVAPCWFSGGVGEGVRFVSPIACPDAPPAVTGDSPEAQQIVATLVQAARLRFGATQVGLFGHSRGAMAAMTYALSADDVEALALSSAPYPPELVARAGEFHTPVLMLHGESDAPGDGGSPMTDVTRAHSFEAALRAAGRPVDTAYYPGGRHNDLFAQQLQYTDEVARLRGFFARREH